MMEKEQDLMKQILIEQALIMRRLDSMEVKLTEMHDTFTQLSSTENDYQIQKEKRMMMVIENEEEEKESCCFPVQLLFHHRIHKY